VAAGFDAGIRVLDDVPRDMIAVRFGPDMRFVAVASPEYLSRHKAPTSPRDLTQHRCVRFRFESGALYKWHLEQRGRAYSLDVAGPITVSNLNLAVDAALAGLGIAWIPEERVAIHVANGRLVQILKKWSPAIPGLCLYYPANRHPPTALRLFAQAVREWAARHQNGMAPCEQSPPA
jgi:DNA-binding transcriptional LysR family regulator